MLLVNLSIVNALLCVERIQATKVPASAETGCERQAKEIR